MPSVPPVVKPVLRAALHQLGGLALLRYRHRQAFRILMYHRFPEGAEIRRTFVAQCEHFRRHYQPVTLNQIAASLESGTPLPPNAMAITIDDGYRDFLERGVEVFESCDLPVTVFLVTDFLDRRSWMWTDVISYVVANARRDTLSVGTEQFSLAGVPARGAAARQIIERAKRLPNDERVKLIAELPVLLDVELPQNPPGGMQPLTWDEVRALMRRNVEFGAHTKSHPILSRMSNEESQRYEMEESKRRLEAELGCAASHFCYPNGAVEDFNQTSVDCTKSLGFRTAVTTIREFNYLGANPFLLKRFGMEPGSPLPFAMERVEGLHP